MKTSCYRKALYSLKEFKNALESLEEGLKLEGQNQQTKMSGLFNDFINKCKKELPPPVVEETKPTPTTSNEATPQEEPAPVPASAPAPVPAPVPTIKYTLLN